MPSFRFRASPPASSSGPSISFFEELLRLRLFVRGLEKLKREAADPSDHDHEDP